MSFYAQVNLTWSTDSLEPVTQYCLHYRKSQVILVMMMLLIMMILLMMMLSIMMILVMMMLLIMMILVMMSETPGPSSSTSTDEFQMWSI